MKKTSQRGHNTLNELNITPLLDLVFVLLVIFIITTPQMMNALDVVLPSGKPPAADPNQPKPKINRIELDEQGVVTLNGQTVARSALKDELKKLKAADPEHDPKVVVKGADEADYQGLIVVLDALQQMEITKVGFATQQ